MILSSLILAGSLWASELSLLDDGSHCVAYKAKKTMFLVSSDIVVGKNCDVSAQILPELGGLYHIEVTVPIRSFKSGNTDRDEDVAKTLKAEVRPDIVFRSKAKTAVGWRELFAKAQFDIEGDLLIGAKSYPITVASRYLQREGNVEVDGVAKVRYADFDIPPPKVVGGLVAKTDPDLELHFHLLASRILGADSIRLEKK